MSCKFFVRHFFLWRVLDYLMMIILAIIAAVIGAKVRPHCRSFEWTDPSINHPFATKETFPMYSVIIAVILVALIYFAGELLTKWKRPVGKLNMCLHINGWIVTHAYSILLAFIFVNVSKLYAGRLRPDFLARLAREGITEANVGSLTHKQLCHAARNGRLSFPSGHSGTSFAGFVPPCIYLMGLMRTLKGGRVWLATIALFPLILPIAVAISRTVDYRHNFDDILAGSLCGALCGIFAVLLSFRPSMRGEWTLRDHPDDVGATRTWMRNLLRSEHVAMVDVTEDDDDDVSSRSSHSSNDHDNDERHHHRDHSAKVNVAPSRTVAARKHRDTYSPPKTKKSAGSGQSSPLEPSSVRDANYISPAVYQERAANPSPSAHRSPREIAGVREQSSADRRKSTGDPAVVEAFYPQE